MNNLSALTESVLSEKEDSEKLKDVIKSMADIYTAHTGTKADNYSVEGINLPSGLAISPFQAAACLVETERTVVFLRGIYKALLRVKKDKPGRKIKVLYAGCGPYAALLTPFTAFFSDEELGFYLLDINRESIDSVKKLYSALHLEGYLNELICADAATYRLPADEVINIVISETMQKSLYQEPQVAIMLNLIPQMADDAIFIPEEICISLKLLTEEGNKNCFFTGKYAPENIDFGPVYTIGRRNCAPHSPILIEMPENPGKFTCLNMFTDITVFGDEKLGHYNSSLNLPVMIGDVAKKNAKKIKFHYELGSSPGFLHEWLE